MSTARTYDPFAIERPKLRLGELGEWELGEMHDERHARFREWHEKFLGLTSEDEATVNEFAAIVGELVAISCIDADDARDVITDMCDASKHGDGARGLQTLAGIVGFLVEYTQGAVSVGEG